MRKMKFKLSDSETFRELTEEQKRRRKNARNRKAKARYRANKRRKRELELNAPAPQSVSDVLKAVSESRKRREDKK